MILLYLCILGLFVFVILLSYHSITDYDDIKILYKRTDKRTKEFELEKQNRVKLQKRLAKVEHDLRQLNGAVKSCMLNVKDLASK